MLLDVMLGGSNAGTILNLIPYTSNTTASIGLDGLAVYTIGPRATVAITGGNTFTAKQTFAAGSTTGAPLGFQSGVLMTTPSAHSIEWDGTSMYLTTSSAVRTTNVVNTTVPATSTSTGVIGQIAVDNTNNWLYVCTATNVWKRVALTTF
jgi:hypothetical protein